MELWEDIESAYRERTPASRELFHDTREDVAAGVASTYRAWEPYPVYVDRAEGVHLQDVDGNRYLDFDMNNGAGMSGHAHPAVREAVADQLGQGALYTHPHGASQQWTVSVQHEAEHVDEHLEAFKQVAPRLAEEQPRYLEEAPARAASVSTD